MKSLLLAAALMLTPSLYADQCSWNDRAIADRARNAILALSGINNTQNTFIVEHCTHCGGMASDKAYKIPLARAAEGKKIHRREGDDFQIKVEKIKSRWSDEEYWGLNVYDSEGDESLKRDVDLAYAFVKSAPGVFASLAYIANCSLAVEEPPFIYVDGEDWAGFRDASGFVETAVKVNPVTGSPY